MRGNNLNLFGIQNYLPEWRGRLGADLAEIAGLCWNRRRKPLGGDVYSDVGAPCRESGVTWCVEARGLIVDAA